MLDEDRRSPALPGGAPAVVAVVAGVGFVALLVLVAVAWAPLLALDGPVVAAANALMSLHPALVAVVRGVTNAGSPFAVDVLTAATAVVLLLARRYRAVVYLVAVRLLELAVETAVKYVVDRPRPVPDVVLATASGTSFPSGHTAGTAAFWVSVLVIARPVLRRVVWGVAVAAAVAAVAGVAASRVLLGVHYPSDVVGGALLGVFCAVALTVVLPRPAPG